jgi:hypothetical protein
MTKAKKSAKAATQFGSPLTLTIIIPAPAVPLFQAMAALKIAQHQPLVKRAWKKGRAVVTGYGPRMTLKEVAEHAVVRWIVSEEATAIMDKAINHLLGTTEESEE